jgi:hypothetical protein
MAEKAKKPAAGTDREAYRNRDLERKRELRAKVRDITIPPCKDPERRERCRDPFVFLQTYFPEKFYLPTSDNHREMVAIIVEAMMYGGSQALAEPRGYGKTTTLQYLSLWAIQYNVLSFLLYVAANKPEADSRLEELKIEMQNNDLLLEDFPEFYVPIRALNGNSQRTKGQTVNGELTNIVWVGDRIVMPTVPGTAARGQCITTRGIESGIRGAKHRGFRPEFCLIDDPQTRESAMSPTQTTSRCDVIERDIGGAGDNRRKMASVALVTIIQEGDLADQLTNRERFPAWQGIRRKLLAEWPKNTDLWDKYIEMYQENQREGDRFAREAHKFYLDNREAMDAGAVVAWKELYFGRHMNFTSLLEEKKPDADTTGFNLEAEREANIRALSDSSVREFFSDKFKNLDDETIASLSIANILPDGSEIEASALQHAFNIIAEKGMYSFRSECQNEPVDSGGEEDRLKPEQIMAKINHLPRNAIPSECEHISLFIDVHKTPLYYTVMAFAQNYPAYLIDYGTYPASTRQALMEATGASSLEGAIHAGLTAITEAILGRTYLRDDGVEMKVGICLIDSAWGSQTDTVYNFCRQNKYSGHVYPSRGLFIKPDGVPLTRAKKKKQERIGHNWRMSPAPNNPRLRLVQYDANYFKSFVHERLKTMAGEPGCLSLFGGNPKQHGVIAEHIVAERARRVVSATRGAVDVWSQIPGRDNHYLDCLAGNCVGASILGVNFKASDIGQHKDKKGGAGSRLRPIKQGMTSPRQTTTAARRPPSRRINTSY